MELEQAVALINNPRIRSNVKTIWADLGCGTGLFTQALASMLAPGSIIYAIDKNETALRKIPSHPGITIQKVVADFIHDELDLQEIDGILMANSFHFVNDKHSFLKKISALLKSGGSYLIVEYDMDSPNPWVPFPISFLSLQKLFHEFGRDSVHKIYQLPSRYNRSNIYSVIAE